MSRQGSARPAYRIDGASVSREAFYAAACDPGRSVAVEACAGAGKTWMLVSRILRALLAGAEPHEILAITFTRKAAGEMRARLNQWLFEFAAPRCDDSRRIRELQDRGLGEAEARALAPALGRLYEQVLTSGRSVEIRTFHGWFSQLLRAAPIELLTQLGLDADMEVVDDLSDHWPRVLRRFHAAVLADPVLADDYRALVRSRGRAQLRKWLDAAWQKRIEIELADAAGTLACSVPPAMALGVEYVGLQHPAERIRSRAVDAGLRGAATAMLGHKGAVCRRQGEALAVALTLDDAEARFEAARAALFTAEGKPRQKLDAPGVAEAAELLERIGCACRQQSAHEEHLRLVRLSRVLLDEAARYKRARGLADMADLERCALALLRDSTLSGWVQERLDTRIRHLLIDEFQDTSPLQWHALEAWLSGYAGAGGGGSGQRPPGIFIVGDPKQSIYRFRRAEPRVFDAACAFVVEGLDGNLLACDHTRRNAPEVLDAVNAVFVEAQQAGEFTGFRMHTTEISATPRAGVFALPQIARPQDADGADADPTEWRDSLSRKRVEAEERVREAEARQVAAAVGQLVVEGFGPGDIQVLCRKRESLRLVAESLAARHVPHAAAEDFPLLESAEARDLIAVLDVLASPRHALSLAHALRSPLFGASDDDLLALARASEPHGDWWRALMQGGATSASLRRAADLLSRWRAAARTLPPHDLLDCVVAEGELRERLAAAVPHERRAGALAAIDAVLNLALTLDGARYATPYNFVRALKRRAVSVAAPGQRDAVQLHTVHGAKGLEARAVFLMDADPEPKNGDTATLLIEWPVESAFPTHCAFVYSEVNCPPSLVEVRDREFAARRREELNGLYVAMSRARERLVVSATEPFRKITEPSWWQRVAAHALPVPPVDAAPAPVPVLEASIALPALPQLTRADEFRRADVGRRMPAEDADHASSLGQAVHRVLEWAALPHADGVRDLIALAEAAAQEFGASAPEVARLAGRIRNSPDCARFFGGPGLRWAGNEVVVADGGDVLRIDRLVEIDEAGGPVWWVLDYKLQHAPERLVEYREQLLRYRRAVRALQPGAVVRCAFITGEGAVVEVA